jgi:hypothetical protein
MSDCCLSSCTKTAYPKKHTCPVNGKEYGLVSSSTIKHHIKEPWLWNEIAQGYYFCSDPTCEVVYFGQDDSVINKSSMRTEVGIKENDENALLCYCYGVTKAEAKNSPGIRDFVVQETQKQHCACESRNPSGKCCLSEFPKSGRGELSK